MTDLSVCLSANFQVLHTFDGVETHVLMEQNWYTQVIPSVLSVPTLDSATKFAIMII